MCIQNNYILKFFHINSNDLIKPNIYKSLIYNNKNDDDILLYCNNII